MSSAKNPGLMLSTPLGKLQIALRTYAQQHPDNSLHFEITYAVDFEAEVRRRKGQVAAIFLATGQTKALHTDDHM